MAIFMENSEKWLPLLQARLFEDKGLFKPEKFEIAESNTKVCRMHDATVKIGNAT